MNTVAAGTRLVLIACLLGAGTPRVQAEESRWALLVGIDEYVDPGISDLTGSVNDVVAIREALVTAGRFPSSQVFLLTSDDPGAAPTRGNIRARLDHIARNADSDDLVYVHFSLHALLDAEADEGYLLTHRTDPRDYQESGLPLAELRQRLEALAAPKRVLVLDGCRNDPQRGRGDADNPLDERFSRGLVLSPREAPAADLSFTQNLFACSPGERAYEWPGRDRGLFSVALEEGLRGEADGAGGDGDGKVSLAELCQYVRVRVPDLLALHLPDRSQHPDVPEPAGNSGTYSLSDALPGGGRLAETDLPRVTRRAVAPVLDLEAVFALQPDKEPSVILLDPPSAPLTKSAARRVTMRWQADVDRGVRGYRYRLDDGNLVEHRRTFVDLTIEEPGEHTFQVQVQDHWGNWSAPARADFQVLSNRRPEVTFVSPAEAQRVEGQRVLVELSGQDGDGTIAAWRLSLDDPDAFVENASGVFSLPEPVDGPHTLFAQAIDDEGDPSLWQSLSFRFRYAEPKGDSSNSSEPILAAAPDAPVDISAPAESPRAVATRTSADAAAWTRGEPAPDVQGLSLLGLNAQGLPLYQKVLGQGVSMGLVLLPAGTFQMGSPGDEPGRNAHEGPQHPVSVPAFLMSQTECTQAQWQAVMGASPSSNLSASLELPVEMVSWLDVQTFERQCGLELPSEAQWEYAARGGQPGPRHGEAQQVAWHGANSSGQTRPVGTLAANGFGLADMLGNVWEWCEDTYQLDYNGAPGHGGAWTTAGADRRVARGGGFSNQASDCRSAARNRYRPADRSRYVGFRVVHNLR